MRSPRGRRVTAARPAARAVPSTRGLTRFAALRDRYSRPYLITAGLSMMGDNIEHVITYWVLWQRFHSTALTGFEIISHWTPSLLLSMTFGSFAQRFDCRRQIQAAQALFMLVSVGWGVLFATGSLTIAGACALLVLHGCAGSLWGPAEQLLLHDFAEPENLPSAIRLNATFRSLGILVGPAVGSVLLLGLGPVAGIFANVLSYLPMTLLLFWIPFTGHDRDRSLGIDLGAARAPIARPGAAIVRAVRTIREANLSTSMRAMLALGGVSALFLGSSILVSLPSFATTLGAGSAGLAYGALLVANGSGGVVGGFLLEALGVLRPSAATAILACAANGALVLVFATTHWYAVAVGALVLSGIAGITFQSVSQSIVQLEALPAQRGRVVGLFNTVSGGFKTGSGVILALLGTLVGVQHSIAVSASMLLIGALTVGMLTVRAGRRRVRV